MQAITTKYIGPTNVRGSRVKAIAAAGSITLAWDDSLTPNRNHLVAAKALAEKYKWVGIYFGGTIVSGETVWVCADDRDSFVMTSHVM